VSISDDADAKVELEQLWQSWDGRPFVDGAAVVEFVLGAGRSRSIVRPGVPTQRDTWRSVTESEP
jgi:hypothetical protein